MSMNEDKVVVVFVTTPQGKGKEIVLKLLEKRLIACANIVNATSTYWWKNKIEEAEEELLIMKTTRRCIDKLMDEIKKIHPYEVPEILVLDVIKADTSYAEWVMNEVECKTITVS
ncbi:MAG: divalent-cation tolerance protein CutA [Pyrodictiaceae archaeon]